MEKDQEEDRKQDCVTISHVAGHINLVGQYFPSPHFGGSKTFKQETGT